VKAAPPHALTTASLESGQAEGVSPEARFVIISPVPAACSSWLVVSRHFAGRRRQFSHIMSCGCSMDLSIICAMEESR